MFAAETRNKVYPIIERWLNDESHRRPQLAPTNFHQWKVHTDPTTNPQQRGLTDCGVYAITFLHLLSQNQPITNLEHTDIPPIREILLHTILEDGLDPQTYTINEEEEDEEED